MKNQSVIVIVLVVILFSLGSKCLFALDQDAALKELKRLNIEVTGPAIQIEDQLPMEFSGAYWGLLSNICSNSGWDLSAYAGKKVISTCFSIEEKFGDELLNVWVISSGDKIVCVHKTVREGSELAPGIFPVKNSK